VCACVCVCMRVCVCGWRGESRWWGRVSTPSHPQRHHAAAPGSRLALTDEEPSTLSAGQDLLVAGGGVEHALQLQLTQTALVGVGVVARGQAGKGGVRIKKRQQPWMAARRQGQDAAARDSQPASCSTAAYNNNNNVL
jgi:hypothetical protein